MNAKSLIVELTLTLGFAVSASIDVGRARQVFWDDYLVDTAMSTATRVLHTPEYAGIAFDHDEPWEGDGSDFHNIVVDEDEKGRLYRMYYLGWMNETSPFNTNNLPLNIRVCYAESRDGISWTKPKLGLREFLGSKENNVIFDYADCKWDNFQVFKDDNPACPKDEIYKAVARTTGFGGQRERVNPKGPVLSCYLSADGIHFRKGWPLVKDYCFDTLNVGFWNANDRLYHLYIRNFHRNGADRNGDSLVRDIRHLVSADFRNWSEPKLLNFLPYADGTPKEDCSLYTNVIEPYYRAPQVMVGFPSRYVERQSWTPNYDRLPEPDRRRARMDPKRRGEKRYGLVVTDCVFMMSRDGQNFERDEDAYMRPGPQYVSTWRYGDCYPARGLVETASRFGTGTVLSQYVAVKGGAFGGVAPLARWEIRLDGFVSRHGEYRGQKLVTKPFRFKGTELAVNFATSARGRMFVTLKAEGGDAIRSVELFGDETDRVIDWTEDAKGLSGYNDRIVTLEFELFDADVYAFKFN
ncbi:MAG: hypothetical protein KBT68_00210 [bacterium]|nr:hypothetical protein [Candidatus Colisoma equi]